LKISQQFGYCFFTHADTWTFFFWHPLYRSQKQKCAHPCWIL
jgi:hypothetical protein